MAKDDLIRGGKPIVALSNRDSFTQDAASRRLRSPDPNPTRRFTIEIVPDPASPPAEGPKASTERDDRG